MRFDRDRGTLYLVFRESGTYTAAHGDLDGFVRSGEYALNGEVFTWLTWDDCPPGDYLLKVRGQGQFLLFEELDDPDCSDRRDALHAKRWDRFVPTPTPTSSPAP